MVRGMQAVTGPFSVQKKSCIMEMLNTLYLAKAMYCIYPLTPQCQIDTFCVLLGSTIKYLLNPQHQRDWWGDYRTFTQAQLHITPTLLEWIQASLERLRYMLKDNLYCTCRDHSTKQKTNAGHDHKSSMKLTCTFACFL